ncbi:hypothetical protein GCM10009851_05900 [Herbiconiux moechotypicola]|uniref:alpha-amylase n=1 Tax=Herbiconiux moechotypicola TaxID=637393 RepID=A0ABN3D9H4_9MICO
MSGTARAGLALTASAGTWTPKPTTLAYQWTRGTTSIPGATASTYRLTAADVGSTITVTVSASRTGYTTTSKTSAATAKVAKPLAFTTAPTPTVAGTARVGATLTATTGTWSPAPTLRLQWNRDGAPITGATGQSLTLGAADAGHRITVTVTASRAGYTTTTRTSAATPTVATRPFTTAPTPAVTGTAKVGSTLTAKPGTWSPAATTTAFQWKRGGASIPGATASTYLLVGADAGTTVTVTVTVKRSGYTTTTRTSTPTAAIAKGTLTIATPTVTGQALTGSTLTASPGTWGPAPVSFTYAWYRGTAAIPGATAKSYTPTAADVGSTLSVRITGAKTGYSSATKISAATAVVRQPVSTLGGRVTGPAGAVAGATVTLKQLLTDGSYRDVSTARTTSDGRFQFTGLTPGRYNLHVSAPPNYVAAWYSSSAFSVTGSSSYTADTTLAYATSSIGGTARTTGGQAISGVRVTLKQLLTDGSYRDVVATSTDATGRYAFRGVTPGRYNLLFDGGTAFVSAWYSTAAFSVEGGSSYTADRTLASVTSTLGGTVTASGAPISGVTVTLRRFFDDGTTGDSTVTTGANGAFSFTGLQPGRYNVYYDGGSTYGGAWYSTAPFTVAGGTSYTANKVLAAATSTLDGVVTSTSGQVISGVRVTLKQLLTDGSYRDLVATATDTNGRYRFTGLTSGRYNVYFDGTPNFGAGWYSTTPFDVQPGVALTASTTLAPTPPVSQTATARVCFAASGAGAIPSNGLASLQFSADGQSFTPYGNSVQLDARNCGTVTVPSAGWWQIRYDNWSYYPVRLHYVGTTAAHYFVAGEYFTYPTAYVRNL